MSNNNKKKIENYVLYYITIIRHLELNMAYTYYNTTIRVISCNLQ